MKRIWEKIFKKYIDNFYSINQLSADGIIDEETTAELKNALLADIIITFESEVEE